MAGARVTVRVVEPDACARSSVRTMLETLGVPVEEYATGEELLADCDEVSRGCVLTEVELPDMCGFDLREALESVAPRLSVIMAARTPDVALAVRALRAGAVDFLEKPLVSREVVQRVREALDGRTRRGPTSREPSP
jgi:FixJ family two-component response regulator